MLIIKWSLVSKRLSCLDLRDLPHVTIQSYIFSLKEYICQACLNQNTDMNRQFFFAFYEILQSFFGTIYSFFIHSVSFQSKKIYLIFKTFATDFWLSDGHKLNILAYWFFLKFLWGNQKMLQRKKREFGKP